LWRGTRRAGIARDQPAARHEQLIVDLIENITLWDLRVTGSEASERATPATM